VVRCGITENEVFSLTGLKYQSISCNLTIGLDDIRKFLREWEISEEFMRNSADPRIIWSMYAAKVCSE
jgi:hypothetical protein